MSKLKFPTQSTSKSFDIESQSNLPNKFGGDTVLYLKSASMDLSNIIGTTGLRVLISNTYNTSSSIKLSSSKTVELKSEEFAEVLWSKSKWQIVQSSIASKLANSVRISITGDINYQSDLFDGSTSVSGTATLPSITTAGTYTQVQVNEKGQVISGSNPTISWSNISSKPAIFTGTPDGNGYYQLIDPLGSTSQWIRVTSSGLIPNSPGVGSLGTQSWPFSNIYGNNIVGGLVTGSNVRIPTSQPASLANGDIWIS
jgi:hypothetical protein